MLPINLVKFRKLNKMTQKDVALKLNISPQAYARYERTDEKRNEPSAENLKVLSEIFKVSIDELIGNSSSYKKQPSNLMFNHLEGFSDLSEEDQKRIEQSLTEQAEFLIAKAKKNNSK